MISRETAAFLRDVLGSCTARVGDPNFADFAARSIVALAELEKVLEPTADEVLEPTAEERLAEHETETIAPGAEPDA